MYWEKTKEFQALYVGNKIISVVYQGAAIIWQAIKSCFGKGIWINSAPWVNTDGWKNLP